MMEQSRIDSLMEAFTNILVGFTINFVANWFLLPLFLGVEPDLGTFLGIGLAYTIISIIRSYAIRRLFNGRTVWQAIKEKLQWKTL